MDWITVSGWEELPVGEWLVQLTVPHFHSVFAVASVHTNITVIGAYFTFDLEGDVIAYQALPEGI